jgi:hypothetical protein
VAKKNWKQKFEEENATFAAEAQQMSVEDKKQRVVDLSKGLLEIEQSLEADEAVKTAKEQLKELMAPYKESQKLVRGKIKYLIELLNESDSQ